MLISLGLASILLVPSNLPDINMVVEARIAEDGCYFLTTTYVICPEEDTEEEKNAEVSRPAE